MNMINNTTIDNNVVPYESLTPDVVLDSLEQQGYLCNGHLLALNSYENRVYQIGLDSGDYLIAKFYRPGRWSDDTILEEHEFSLELASYDLPVITPLPDSNNNTLFHFAGFRFALFPRSGGRAPELDNPEHLKILGRLMGRIHSIAAIKPFHDRPKLTLERFGIEALAYLLDNECIAPEVRFNFEVAANDVLSLCEQQLAVNSHIRQIRLHGDCHPGNILWTDTGAHFVDLDDCQTGPAIQDLWMFLSGTPGEMESQLVLLLNEYTRFFDFDPSELALIETLRSLRLIHYNAWLARRWSDPAFPLHFPWFDSPRYWEEQLITLREQIERMGEPTLRWPV
ncbi:MAG: serine/threonine protein kinase [Thiohalomonadales bacterium]